MISLFYITMLPFRRKKVISQQRGTYITNGTLILKLLKASYLSKKTAVIHCWGHQVPSNKTAKETSQHFQFSQT